MIDLVECPNCEGYGYHDGVCHLCNGSGEGMHESQRCMSCGGSGEQNAKCSTCDGVGQIDKWYRYYDDKRKCLECGKVLNCLVVDNSETENFEVSLCAECIAKMLGVLP